MKQSVTDLSNLTNAEKEIVHLKGSSGTANTTGPGFFSTSDSSSIPNFDENQQTNEYH